MPSDGAEAHEMIPAERRARIVESLQQRRSVRVSVLSEELGVSEMTIRRDLERLEQEGMLSRMHGGAILKRRMAEEPLLRRAGARTLRGKAAHRRGGGVHDHARRDRLPELRHHRRAGARARSTRELRARIVTHNVGAVSAAQHTNLDIVLLGGSYKPRSNIVAGSLTVQMVEGFHASRFILGADGLSLDEGVTTPSMSLAGVERAMVRQTRGEIVVLADSSKVGAVGDVVICSLDTANIVILDDGVSPEVREEIELLGLQLVVV